MGGSSGSQEPLGAVKMVPGHWYTVPHYATALPGSIVDFKIPNLGKNLARNVQKMLILGSILGVSASQKPQGCSSWSTMVAGH